jgi:hypothetical protein
MLKNAGVLTHPTPPRRVSYPKYGRSELSIFRGGWDDPNCARPTRAF